MHTDDDIFESLDIDSGADSGREDTVVFEDLNMEDQILSSALNDRHEEQKSSRRMQYPEPEKKRTRRELNTEDTSVDRKKFKKETEKRKRSRIKKLLIAAVVELFTLIAIFGYGYFLRNWNLIQRPDINAQAIENNNISVEKKEEMEKGYWTIAIFGVDSRNDNLVERGLNSDVIIIANINRENGDIKLVSVFRDTYLLCLKLPFSALI